jgi:hypothetical protein
MSSDAIILVVLLAVLVLPVAAVLRVGPHERVGRMPYAATCLVGLGLGFAAEWPDSPLVTVGVLALGMPVYYRCWALGAARAQAIGWNRWAVLLALVPLLNLAVVGILLTRESTDPAARGAAGPGRPGDPVSPSTAAARGSDPRSAGASRAAPSCHSAGS